MAGKRLSNMRWVYPDSVEEWEDHRVVPEMHSMGCQKYAEAYFLASHCHGQAYEFVYLEQGSVTWEVEGKHYLTQAGQWFFTKPGEPHRARSDHMEPSKVWWMIVADPAAEREWFRLSAAERESVLSRLRQLPRVFRADRRVRDQFDRLKATLETASADRELYARHQVLDILLGLLETAPAPVTPINPSLRDAMVRLVDRMTQHLDLRPTVAEMAEEVRVSESYFYNLFNEMYGQSPYAYLERLRIERACVMLGTGQSVTEISFDLGYKTSQHFATVFKKLTGLPPSRWRKKYD